MRLAGVTPEEVTDIVISHAHWDHMGGIDLFPKANVWIQKDEYRYYTMDAWQPGGDHGGIDPEDAKQLVQLNTEGRIRLVDGDNVRNFPRHSRVHRRASHLRFAISARGRKSHLRSGLGQLLSVSKLVVSYGQRDFHRR